MIKKAFLNNVYLQRIHDEYILDMYTKKVCKQQNIFVKPIKQYYGAPKGTSVEKMYVISFRRNHFVRTKYVISFPRNVIRHHEIYHIIIYYHIYIYIYITYISYISHTYISYISHIIHIHIFYTYTYFFFISFIYTGTLHSAIGRFSMLSTFHILHWLHICQIHGDK